MIIEFVFFQDLLDRLDAATIQSTRHHQTAINLRNEEKIKITPDVTITGHEAAQPSGS